MDFILHTLVVIALITCFGFFLRKIRIYTNGLLKKIGVEVQISRSSYRQFNTLYILLIASHLSLKSMPLSNFVNQYFAMAIFYITLAMLVFKSISWIRKAWKFKGAVIAFVLVQLTMPLAIVGQIALFITAFSVGMLHSRNYQGSRGIPSMQLD